MMRKLLIAAGIVGALLLAWFYRYDLQGSVGGAYLLDRWTGDVYYASPSSINKLKR